MSKTSKQYRDVAHAAAHALGQSDAVLAVWWFGGTQRGRVWEGSDVDLLVAIEEAPPILESYSEEDRVTVHLHWRGRAALEQDIGAEGDPPLHGWVAGGELLFDRDGLGATLADTVRAFPDPYRRHHLLPHLEAMLGWAQDLRKRMALHDERPRRAAARQWEVDTHAAAVLLIEKGLYPHNEATTQALDARLFVPNLADPDEIEAFVAPRLERWLLPALQGERDSDISSSLSVSIPHLLDLAVRCGRLRVMHAQAGPFALQERRYRLTDPA